MGIATDTSGVQCLDWVLTLCITLLCPYNDNLIAECQECHLPLPPPIDCDNIEDSRV